MCSPAPVDLSLNVSILYAILQGHIFVDPAMPSASPQERHAAYTAMAQTLARIHSVDYRKVGLQSFGRHHGYCSRQVTFQLSQFFYHNAVGY